MNTPVYLRVSPDASRVVEHLLSEIKYIGTYNLVPVLVFSSLVSSELCSGKLWKLLESSETEQ